MERPSHGVTASGFVIAAALTAVLVPVGTPSRAEVVEVDAGAIAWGRPIFGTGQNLPPLAGGSTYVAGPSPTQIKYYTSGGVTADQEDVTARAYHVVKRWVAKKCESLKPRAVRRCRATVVFDIDETLLNNLPSPTPGVTSAARCVPANLPVVRLYRSLQARGIRTAIITGRTDTERQDTIACLRQRGVSGWAVLVTRAVDDNRSAAVYKALARKRLKSEGARIVASVGDQVSDMAYGRLVYGFLMPNPVYWIN